MDLLQGSCGPFGPKVGKRERNEFSGPGSEKLKTESKSGSEKGVFWKRGLFRKVHHFLEILKNLEILEILENPQTVEKKEESDHFLEI